MDKVPRFFRVIFLGAVLLAFVPAIALPSNAFASSSLGGMWVAPANGQQVGNSTVLEASAYRANSGDPAITYVNFTGWFNGKWNIICHVTSPTYSNVYECPWMLKGVISPGDVTISFDVYNQAGQVNSAPNGFHSIHYVPPSSATWCECTTYVANYFGLSNTYPNAKDWPGWLSKSGWKQALVPSVGNIVVFQPQFGAGIDQTAGHVGIITAVQSVDNNLDWHIKVEGSNQGTSEVYTKDNCTNVLNIQFMAYPKSDTFISYWTR